MREAEPKLWFYPPYEQYGNLSEYKFEAEAWRRLMNVVRTRHDQFEAGLSEDDRKHWRPDLSPKICRAVINGDDLEVRLGLPDCYEVEFTFYGEGVAWKHR